MQFFLASFVAVVRNGVGRLRYATTQLIPSIILLVIYLLKSTDFYYVS